MPVGNGNNLEITQEPIEPHLSTKWDVVVVGAGPAGSIAAFHLAVKGHRVLLVDRERFPREKVCGDGLIADALGALDRAGLGVKIRSLGRRLGQTSVFSPSRIEVPVPGEYVTLKRLTLDALTAHRAQEAGAVFCQAHIADVEVETDGSVSCRVEGVDRPLLGYTALVATGANVGLLRKHQMVKVQHPSAVALRCYVKSRFVLDRLIVSFDRSIIPGYAWIFPIRGGEYNVGCGIFYRNSKNDHTNLREMFSEFCREFPLMRKLMNQAEGRTPLQGAPLRSGLRGVNPVGPGNLLAAGESIGATFPFTGEGIGKAMQTGELAAQTLGAALRKGDFSGLRTFGSLLRTELDDKYLGYKIAEKWLSISWLNDFLTRRARRSRFVQESFAGIINETVDPRDVFSIRGVIRSFLR